MAQISKGSVITGSSNFSYSGLKANREFNVELKDSGDVDFALNQFEDLWKDSVDVSKDCIATIDEKTWLNENISPYELYLKMLYEYFEEEISFDEKLVSEYLPDGFMNLEYQRMANCLS